MVSSGQVIPGNPDGSPLLQSIEANRMPPAGPLSAVEKSILRAWIQGGAAAPTAPIVVEPLPPLGPNYNSLAKNVFGPKCSGCHNATKATAGYAFDTYASVMKSVRAGRPSSSKLYTVSQSGEMPPQPDPVLNSDELRAISDWITEGALNN
ncbi:MAG: hypothetical protein BroJett040_17030 [Oligoflexia bacterium]|nr:MAG: hypothetical protein BroJett040_17030 [Oligoflexia bacterium]